MSLPAFTKRASLIVRDLVCLLYAEKYELSFVLLLKQLSLKYSLFDLGSGASSSSSGVNVAGSSSEQVENKATSSKNGLSSTEEENKTEEDSGVSSTNLNEEDKEVNGEVIAYIINFQTM